MELTTQLDTTDLVKSKNIAELLSEDELSVIGQMVHDEWQLDLNSRSEWESKTAEALKLAMQVSETKTFPWENASNVKFPILTVAALQFQSRAYPALIPTVDVVKARVYGDDPTGEKAARAARVASYMSFQVLEEDSAWEKNMDAALLSLAIVGCAFKKTYFCPVKQHNVSEHILAKDLYIPYFAETLENASRITQMLYMTKNQLLSKERNGIFLPLETTTDPTETVSELTDAEDEAQGMHGSMNDPAAPREILEQHRYLDLDKDGYEEPYIVTIDRDTKQVLRIVARYVISDIQKNGKGEIMYITPTHYYTKYTFIPSPDGGIYDLGLGSLLSPVNKSIDTVLNQLIDAGTLSNTAGGFLGRGVKFKSGDNSFRPFEWKRVDSTGDDLRKGIVPLQVREPSMVLFQLLGTLIDYGERVGMATDPQVGINPGQNTPAETSRNTIAEGQRVFSAIFKRIYRSLKEEFQKLYKLNSIYLNDETSYYSLSGGQQQKVLRSDFLDNPKEVCPAADPNMITKEDKIRKLLLLKESSTQSPGLYNSYAIEKKLLEALEIDNVEEILPDPAGPNAIKPQPDTKVLIETMKLEQKAAEFKSNMQIKMFDLMQELEYLRAEIVEKESRAALNLAQAEGVEAGHQVAAMQTAVTLMKARQEGLVSALQTLKDIAGFNTEKKGLVDDIKSGVSGMEGSSDNSGVL